MKERPQSSKTLFDLVAARYDDEGNMLSAAIKSDGKEYGDPVPMAPPVGYSPPVQLEQLIEQIIHRRDFQRAAVEAGGETFEEADDFDVEDEDYDPRFPETIYEAYFEAKSRRKADLASRQAAPGGVDGKPEPKAAGTESSPRDDKDRSDSTST